MDDGQAATFSVVASGGALSYQWQREQADIAGATAATLNLPRATLADSGAHFRVVVHNSIGSVTSNAVTLTVNPVGPSVSTAPANVSVTAGQTATFSVTAAGSAPLSYQWQRNGVDIVGATGSSFTTQATVAGDNGAALRVRITNAGGTVISNAATLTVDATPNSTTGFVPSKRFSAGHFGWVVAARADGSIVSWGAAMDGGPGVAIAGSTAKQVGNINNAIGIFTIQTGQTFALRRDGSVWAWGRAGAGALGAKYGSRVEVIAQPKEITQLTSVMDLTGCQLSPDAPIIFALKSDGTVTMMPVTVGYLDQDDPVLPVAQQVADLANIVQIKANRSFGVGTLTGSFTTCHLYAVDRAGDVFDIFLVSTLDAANTRYTMTTQIFKLSLGLPAIDRIACDAGLNMDTCLAVDRRGDVWSWGSNNTRLLGDGTQVDRTLPVKLVTLNGIKDVYLGEGNAFALGIDGRMWSWGLGNYTARDPQSNEEALVPGLVPGLTNVSDFSTTGPLRSFYMAVKADGSLWVWGGEVEVVDLGATDGNFVVSGYPFKVPGINLN